MHYNFIIIIVYLVSIFNAFMPHTVVGYRLIVLMQKNLGSGHEY